ncbi:glutathione S-transferase [Oxalobacteraceae bacterium]|nr:glutathione S-transferase [Oxalobacteraceae bacterium]
MTQASKLTLHGMKLSGHTHKVELLLNLIGQPYQFVETGAPERASAAFLALNPLGQIPVLQDGERVLADSHGILVYLARRYAPQGGWLGEDSASGAAELQRWLSIAAGDVRFGPAAARVMCLWKGPGDLGQARKIAARVLGFMDQHLASRPFLAAENVTIADVACYSYVAHAPEGGVALTPYPAVQAWLARIEALPGFVGMPRSAVTEA